MMNVAVAVLVAALGTLPSTTPRVEYAATGGQTVYSFAFKTTSTAHIQVYKDGVPQYVGYAVALNANQSSSPGGTVTFTVAPLAGVVVRIDRTIPISNDATFSGVTFKAQALDAQLDKFTMQAQQVDRRVGDAEYTHASDKVVQTARDAAQDVTWTNNVAALNGTSHAVTDTSSVLALGSSTARTLAARFGETFNVKDFGALGNWNGVTGADDTAAVQATLDAAAAAGGFVYVPRGKYKITGKLTVREGVTVFGQGFQRSDNATGGTIFYHVPSAPNTDFMLVQASGGYGGSYVNVNLYDFRVWGDAGNGDKSRDGIVMKQAKTHVRNVRVELFAGKTLRLRSMILSQFQDSWFGHADYGLYFDRYMDDGTTEAMVTTTVVFQTCDFESNRIGAFVTNAIGVEFTDKTVFESNTQHALVADGTGVASHDTEVALWDPYFENTAQNAIRVGETGQVNRFVLQGGTYESGILNDFAYDYFYLDRVLMATVSPTFLRPARNALLRTTANTGLVTGWNGYAALNQASGAGNGVRANLTPYTKGQTIALTDSGGMSRTFGVLGNCTTGAAPPVVTRVSANVIDGSCTLSTYGLSQEGGAVWFDRRKGSMSSTAANPSLFRAAGYEVAGTQDGTPGKILRGTGSPEGAVTAPIGSFYSREDGGAGTTLYVKESGTGNTGWVAK